jgi:hypothetical protein
MKQFFLLIFTLIVVSHIYSNVITNSVSNKAANTNLAGSTTKSASTTEAKSANQNKAKSEKHLKPKKKGKGKKNVKIIKIKRKTFKNPIAVIKTSWLKVSTKMFRNTSKFPPIILPNGKEIKIKVDKRYFRLNEAYVKGKSNLGLPPKRRYFWFRLSGKHLYYSMTQSDINILGDVTVKSIITSYASQESNNEKNCFKVVDRTKRNWKLCAETLKERGEWVCKIKEILGKPDRDCQNPNLADSQVVVERKVTQPIILIPLSSPKCNENWDYSKKGSNCNCECSEGINLINLRKGTISY